MTLEFPVEHPELADLPLDALPPAPAPVLLPGPPEPTPEPKPADGPRPMKLKTAAAIAGAVAVVVAVVLVVTIAAVTSRRPAASSPSDVAAPATTTTSAEPVSTSATPDPAPTDEDSARRLLEAQVANDRSQVEALAESWVPQLSSKRAGLVVDGITYDHRAIWTDFTNLRTRYPGALLLWSGDYRSFSRADFWVTVVPQSYPSGDSANTWCDSAGIGKDDCFAKRIAHTGGYAGSTVHRK
ncbi:zinc ribbon domain-containing protein [Amycolatopsis sp. cmx-4-68]|uniref:zinc ribbon domain-containing protein n=1 Tax=Amycolatopsis sp. cmx-4-68 TaxID=2790938 RepID=UPI003978F7FC